MNGFYGGWKCGCAIPKICKISIMGTCGTHGTGDTGDGTWDMVHGTWDTGHGTRDMGHGTWDMLAIVILSPNQLKFSKIVTYSTSY